MNPNYVHALDAYLFNTSHDAHVYAYRIHLMNSWGTCMTIVDILGLLLLLTPFSVVLSVVALNHAHTDYTYYQHITLKQYRLRKYIYLTIIALSALLVIINLALGSLLIKCCYQ